MAALLGAAGRLWISRRALVSSPAQISQVISPELKIYWRRWDLAGAGTRLSEGVCAHISAPRMVPLQLPEPPQGPPAGRTLLPRDLWTEEKEPRRTISWNAGLATKRLPET